jgi:hypothetical protein
MGIASESNSAPSPISPDDYPNSYPESLIPIEVSTLPDLDQNPLYGNVHNSQP